MLPIAIFRKFLCYFIVLISLLSTSYTLRQIPAQCGIRQIRTIDLIVHGHTTVPGEWPWHVAVYHRTGTSEEYACGGTLISEQFVLTAAHCVLDRYNRQQLVNKRIFVRMGVHNLHILNRNYFQQHGIHRVYKPNSFTGTDLRDDIAILELGTLALFDDYVQPACLNLNYNLTGQYGTVIGWGVTEADTVSPVLKSARMPVVDYLTCLKSDRKVFGETLDEGIFCAGYTNGTTVCNGDSGGGLFFKKENVWYLGGIVSFTRLRDGGSNYCHTSSYGAFTKIYTYLSWIASQTDLKFAETEDNLVLSHLTDSAPCTTPTNQAGSCVAIERCRNIINIVNNRTPPSKGIAKYIKKAACTLAGVKRSVCCKPAEVIPRPAATTVRSASSSNLRLLPTECGQRVDDRLAHGNVTKVFSYPWMAVLRYNYSGTIIDRCSGSLINKRYILTAAHCLQTKSSIRFDFSDYRHSVVLGEHTKGQDVDCNIHYNENDEELSRDCAGPIEVFGIESFEVHQDYNPPKYSNDIGLIRLDRDVTMKDHIQPICLPVTDELQRQVFDKYVATGWQTKGHYPMTKNLTKVILSHVEISECQQIWNEFGLAISLSDKQMCAGSKDEIDTCYVNDGVPLGHFATYNGVRFMQFGITTFGSKLCSRNSIPEVFIRVGSYIDWITEHIKP